MGCHFLLQGIFLIQGSHPHLLSLLPWHAGSLPLAPPGKPIHSSVSVKNSKDHWADFRVPLCALSPPQYPDTQISPDSTARNSLLGLFRLAYLSFCSASYHCTTSLCHSVEMACSLNAKTNVGLPFHIFLFSEITVVTFLVAQWLRLHTPNAGDPSSVSGQRTRYHMPQLEKKKRSCIMQLKFLHATRKVKDLTCHN